MKKLSIALALLLCVVICVFCFASCGKKKADATTAAPGTTPTTTESSTTAPATTAEATTAEPTTAPHEHTPEADYTIDKPATCGEDGSKSIHCSECGNIIPGTEVKIDADPTLHVVDEWTTVPATVIKEGKKTGTCTVCGQPVERAVEFEAKVYDSTNAGNDWRLRKNLTDTLDGKHFYPTDENPNGLAYYFEVDFLWNETIATNWIDGDGFRIELVDADSTRDNLYLLVPKNNVWGSSDAKTSGGFDYGWNANHKIVYGPKGVNGTSTDAKNFPNIGEYGWHRIGVKVYQEAAIKGDGVTYSMVSTLYLDGIKAWQITFDEENDKSFSKWLERKLMLFTATNDNGTLVYADPSADLCLDFSAYHTGEMTGVYLVWGAPVSMAVDPDFTPNDAVPVATPEDKTITVAEGVDLPAKIWYKAFEQNDHVYSVEVSVTKEATLIENGTKVMKCAFCDDTKTVEFAYEPEIKKFTKDTKTSYSPNEVTVGTLRGDKHFYEAGNDLLVEYSFLWNETTTNLRNDKNPFIDTRFTNASGSSSKNVIFWSPNLAKDWSECKAAGGFEYGGIDQNEPDNPYPRFNGKHDDITAYPNIGGYNNGDGTAQTNDLYGWHRVSIRYRNEVTNKEALMADGTPGATSATYKLQVWVYIDGKLVIHAYQTDLSKDGEDRKLFSASSDGNGGIAYVENDDLILKPVYLNSNRAKDGTNVYYSIADINVTVGTDFVQNVVRVDNPTAARLEVMPGEFVTSTIWYTKPCAEHTWDGVFTEVIAPTLLGDGMKVEHCSVCGAAHEVPVTGSPVITASNAIAGTKYADNGNKDVAALKNASAIRGEGHFYPDSTEVGAQGNDLWFEYSFLYNETLENRDKPSQLAEMRLFEFRSAATPSNYRGFYYIYFLNDDNKGPKNGAFHTSNDCPYAGHIDYSTYKSDDLEADNAIDLSSEGNTLNGKSIGKYPAGWSVSRDGSPYLWDSKYQTMGGWHRLGFRYHQEVESVSGSDVTYAGYTELYIDGVKVWKVLTAMQGFSYTEDGVTKYKSLKENNLLLWTATAADGVITGYADNDDLRIGFRLDRLDTSSKPVYVGIDDVQWSMGDGFATKVVRVENPKPVKYEVAPGVEVDGAMYFAKPYCVHVDEWTVDTEPTLLNDGLEVNYCAKCGEKLGTRPIEAEKIVYVSSWDAATKDENPYAINDEDYPSKVKPSFGIKKSVKNIRGEDHFYDGNDLLVEFSFLYNESMANLGGESQVLAVMFIENYNLFNINLKTGKITARMRAADEGGPDAYIFPTQAAIDADASLKSVDIGDYGWHRFGVRIHEDAVNNAGTVEYTVIASAYLDGEKIFEIDKTTWVLSKCSDKVEGKLFSATVSGDNLVYDEVTGSTVCDVYVMSQLFFDENSTKDVYLILADVSMTCGKDFVQDVKPVADPAAQTYVVTEGVEFSGKIWYEYDK